MEESVKDLELKLALVQERIDDCKIAIEKHKNGIKIETAKFNVALAERDLIQLKLSIAKNAENVIYGRG